MANTAPQRVAAAPRCPHCDKLIKNPVEWEELLTCLAAAARTMGRPVPALSDAES